MKDSYTERTPLVNLVLNIIFDVVAALFGIFALRAMLCLKWAHRLPRLSSLTPSPGPLPRCSIIFAARDEEARVEQTFRHLLAQRGIDFEVIPVDDRSSDRTSQIFKRIAEEDSRLKPQRVDVLPVNWLGKCHACHVGAQAATGEWLLFTDADCWLAPDVIARALMFAERENVDHITLSPGVVPVGVACEAWHLCFLLSLLDWMAGVNRDRPKAHLGLGAFNLVRTKTYRAFGGHESLRLTVLDDVRLGRLVRHAGGRTRSFLGGDDVECHWGSTLRQMIKIMEKNYFAAVNYNTWIVLALALLVPLTWLVCLVGPFTGLPAGYAAFAALMLMIVPTIVLARRIGWSIRGALITPFVFPLIYYALLISAIVTLRQGGVRWRDTFYPLDLLRKHTVR